MKIDSTNRDKLRKYVITSIAPFSVDGHPQEIVHMHSGKLLIKEINIDSWKTVREKQLQQFISDLPDSFHKNFTAAVLTIKKRKKSIKFNEIEMINTSLIYSRIIALQLPNEALRNKIVLFLELFSSFDIHV